MSRATGWAIDALAEPSEGGIPERASRPALLTIRCGRSAPRTLLVRALAMQQRPSSGRSSTAEERSSRLDRRPSGTHHRWASIAHDRTSGLVGQCVGHGVRLAGATGGANREDECSCLLYTSPSPRDGLLSRM